MEAIHGAQHCYFANLNSLSILVNPWVLGEVTEAEILKITVSHRVLYGRPHLINDLTRLICMSRHGHNHGIHHHVSWYLHEYVR